MTKQSFFIYPIEIAFRQGVGRMGEMHTISVRLIDVETSEILPIESVDCICTIEDVLTNRIRQAALKLAGMSSDDQLFGKR